MDIKKCEESKYSSCDEVAECMPVSNELSRKLWEVMPTAEKVPAENCGSRYEWADCNGMLVSQNWSKFTSEEQIELNKVLTNAEPIEMAKLFRSPDVPRQ